MDDYSSVGWQEGHWVRDLKGLEPVICLSLALIFSAVKWG